jgi:hypothetical protein
MTVRETIILYQLLCEHIHKYFLLILLVRKKIKESWKRTWHMRNERENCIGKREMCIEKQE